MKKIHKTAGLDQLGYKHYWIDDPMCSKTVLSRPHIWKINDRAATSTRARKVKITLVDTTEKGKDHE